MTREKHATPFRIPGRSANSHDPPLTRTPDAALATPAAPRSLVQTIPPPLLH